MIETATTAYRATQKNDVLAVGRSGCPNDAYYELDGGAIDVVRFETIDVRRSATPS